MDSGAVDSPFKMYTKYREFIQSSQVQKKSLLFIVTRPKVMTKEDSPIFIVLTLWLQENFHSSFKVIFKMRRSLTTDSKNTHNSELGLGKTTKLKRTRAARASQLSAKLASSGQRSVDPFPPSACAPSFLQHDAQHHHSCPVVEP